MSTLWPFQRNHTAQCSLEKCTEGWRHPPQLAVNVHTVALPAQSHCAMLTLLKKCTVGFTVFSDGPYSKAMTQCMSPVFHKCVGVPSHA
eukprot:1158073-Pelagomonas_calceolata.AAC.1